MATSKSFPNLKILPERLVNHFKNKDYDICKEKCKEILITDPKNCTALIYLVYIARSEKDYETSIKYLKSVIEIEPRLPFMWSLLGEIYIELERFKEARDAYIEEIALYAKKAGPWCMAAMCAQKNGEIKLAIDLLKYAKEKVEKKGQSIISYTLGTLEEIAGNKDEALINYIEGQLTAKNKENKKKSAGRIYNMLTKK